MWFSVIGDLSAEQIGNGVRNLINFADDNGNASFPPNAGQFRDLCLSSFDWEHTRQSRPAAEVLLDKPVDLGADRLIEHDVKPLTPADALAQMRATVGLTEEHEE